MANLDKDIRVNPNNGSSSLDPNIVFSGASETLGPQNITLTAETFEGGRLSFTGSAGQLFTVTATTAGSVLSINDVSGIPNVEVYSDGSVILVPSSGAFNYTNCPAFKVENTTAGSAFAANAVATWNNISYNNGGHFASNRFTAPWSGIYFFSCMMLSNQNTQLFHNLRVNGTNVAGTLTETYTMTQFQTNTATMVHFLNPGDFVDVLVRGNAAYGSSYANFSGFQIG
jgi:hypothetical protein